MFAPISAPLFTKQYSNNIYYLLCMRHCIRFYTMMNKTNTIFIEIAVKWEEKIKNHTQKINATMFYKGIYFYWKIRPSLLVCWVVRKWGERSPYTFFFFWESVERQLSWKNRLNSDSPWDLVNYPYRFDWFMKDMLNSENLSSLGVSQLGFSKIDPEQSVSVEVVLGEM